MVLTTTLSSCSSPIVNGAAQEVPQNGTQAPAWAAVQDADPNTGVKNNDYFQTITAMPDYRAASLEVRSSSDPIYPSRSKRFS